MKRNKPVMASCEECGTSFRTWPSRIRVGRGRCCSKPCAATAQAKRLTGIPRPEVQRPIAERLADKLDKSGSCWEFTGKHNDYGYGLIWQNGVEARAHRVAWELAHGMIPDDLLVLHHCDNPPCCRPEHLFLGTHADNTNDMLAKGRHRNAYTARDR